MGFQGDVAGIGLGELLQGLARGGREGVLTLNGGSITATIGLEGGQLFLLPVPGEDPDQWRRRSQRAWVKDPNERIDSLRMSEIAYAARLEVMFQLLDSEGVHFRFEPGPLPNPNEPIDDGRGAEELGRAETGARTLKARTHVHCPGVSVEYLLLEFARLSDEGSSYHGPPILIHEVPQVLGHQPPSPEYQRFWDECDGMSNVVEIADRLGWPVRQCRATLQELFVRGHVRLADAREMLVLVQRELVDNRFARAASRLAGWVSKTPPGPAPLEEAGLLIAEWNRGKLPAMVASMAPREARTVLKRLEMAEGDMSASIQRWRKMREHHKHDSIAELRQIKWQLEATDEADAVDIADVLRIARKFQDQGYPSRAGITLRAAAELGPESTGLRLELGQRMLAVGLSSEASPWILDACRTLIEQGLSAKAVPPLRTLTNADPSSREARALLNVARKNTASGKKVRRNTLIALCAMLMVSLGALVKVQIDQDIERRLSDIGAMIDRPLAALDELDVEFPDSDKAPVTALRQQLVDRIVDEQSQIRDAWLERYREAELECTLGDPLLGLERTLALPQPPQLADLMGSVTWPDVHALLDGLAGRLEQTVAVWDQSPDTNTQELRTEERLGRLVEDLAELAAASPGQEQIGNFELRLNRIAARLGEREEERAQVRERLASEQRLEKQNMLLATARSHAEAGDLERAVDTYRELLSMPNSKHLRRALAQEVEQVESHLAAVREAVALAERGEHGAALLALEGPCPHPGEHLIPWRVETWPEGARVTLPDGWVRVAPFTMHSAFGEDLELLVELDGHESLTYPVQQPGDIKLHLSRRANRAWPTEHPVTAVPVPIDQDHVCADRAGHIVRLGEAGEVWRASVESLAGIGRTPVSLPKEPSRLLVLTEDGDAWLVDSETGATEGPWSGGEPPHRGPHRTARAAEATLIDMRKLVWTDSIEPQIDRVENLADPAREDDLGDDAGMVVLRRRATQGTRVDSAWTPFFAEVHDDHYKIWWSGKGEPVFTVRRTGDWHFLAWEAPNARRPAGRLWISDDAGLRAFEP